MKNSRLENIEIKKLNPEVEIFNAIKDQDAVGRSITEKLAHQLREMNAMILENANCIIAKETHFSLDAGETNIKLAMERKRELESLKRLLIEEFGNVGP